MASAVKGIKKMRYQRVRELLVEGLTSRQIHERTGVTVRQVLRLKKQMDNGGDETV